MRACEKATGYGGVAAAEARMRADALGAMPTRAVPYLKRSGASTLDAPPSPEKVAAAAGNPGHADRLRDEAVARAIREARQLRIGARA